MTTTEQSKRKTLIQEGFCLFEQVLDAGVIDRIAAASDRLLDAQEAEHFARNRSSGSMASIFDDPAYAELIAWPAALEALRSLGYDRPTFMSGYVISKPPHSPPLFWHQDWFLWDHPHSYSPVPQQLFLMYYMVDTSPHNGCLRLIPGSHLKRHAVHDLMEVAHTDEIQRATDLTNPVFHDQPGEIDVCVRAGDLVIGDSRLLHSARANESDTRRTVITLWYHPVFYELPEPMQALLGKRRLDANDWFTSLPEAMRDSLRPLVATYDGDAEPMESSRTPGADLV